MISPCNVCGALPCDMVNTPAQSPSKNQIKQLENELWRMEGQDMLGDEFPEMVKLAKLFLTTTNPRAEG